MGKLKDYGPSQWPNMGKTFTGNKEYVLKNLNQFVVGQTFHCFVEWYSGCERATRQKPSQSEKKSQRYRENKIIVIRSISSRQ